MYIICKILPCTLATHHTHTHAHIGSLCDYIQKINVTCLHTNRIVALNILSPWWYVYLVKVTDKYCIYDHWQTCLHILMWTPCQHKKYCVISFRLDDKCFVHIKTHGSVSCGPRSQRAPHSEYIDRKKQNLIFTPM